jgi:hypothetical protein
MENLFRSTRVHCIHACQSGHHGDPKELKKNIPSDLKDVGFDDVVAYLSKFIDTLPETNCHWAFIRRLDGSETD